MRKGRKLSAARLALAFSAGVHLLLLSAWPSAPTRADGKGPAFFVARLVRLPSPPGESPGEEPEETSREVERLIREEPVMEEYQPAPGAEKGAESEAVPADEFSAVAGPSLATDRPAHEAAGAAPAPGVTNTPRPADAPGEGDGGSAVPAFADRGAPSAGDVSAILSEIRRRVESRKIYPPLARRRGWEGSVTVEIELDGGGDLEGVRLLRPSGYAVLDRATVAAVREAVPYPPLSGKVRIPVSYRLRP